MKTKPEQCYLNYVEIITNYESQCNEENFVETLESRSGTAQMMHYMLENGMHIYIANGPKDSSYKKSIRISKRPLTSLDKTKDVVESQEDFLHYQEFSDGYSKVGFEMQRITSDKYKTDVTRQAVIEYSAPQTEGQQYTGYCFLPAQISEPEFGEDVDNYVMKGETSTDISEALEATLLFTTDKQTREWYKQAYEDYTEIIEAPQLDQRNMGENLSTTDLNGLSIAQLEELLKSLEEGNTRKEDELESVRREYLLKRIIAEQKRGKELDIAIRDVRNKEIPSDVEIS